MGSGKPELSYCAREVRDNDHDRYLTALFVPAAHREAVFALYAFNTEVARTREAVSEPILGQIRLQWWREAVDGIYDGNVREHPVVEGLKDAVDRYGLDKAGFMNLLEARADDLDDAPPADLAALENYAAATSGTLTSQVMAVLAFTDGPPQRAAHLVGTAWALIGLMRAVGFHAQAQRLYLPDDLLRNHNVDRRVLFDLNPSPALNDVVREVTLRAAELLAEARSLKAQIPRAARCGLLLGILADRYLADIARAGYDPLALLPAAPARPLRLSWASVWGAY